MMEGHRRVIATAEMRIEDMLSDQEKIARLARQEPQDVFEAIVRVKDPKAYALLAGIYRKMMDNGEGDPECITRLWNTCLERSADYLGIEFQKQTPKMPAKPYRSPRSHGGYRRK